MFGNDPAKNGGKISGHASSAEPAGAILRKKAYFGKGGFALLFGKGLLS